MNKIAKNKRPDGADITGGIALIVVGVATRAAPLIILGGLLIGKGASALKKKATDGGAQPLPRGFTPDLKKVLKNPVQKQKPAVKDPPHSHLTDANGQFDPVTGYYALPDIEPCVCPKCGTVTDTSRRFCYKCDTDLKKVHGGSGQK